MVNLEEKIIETLTEAGYEAYYVGGCVRDEQLGQPAFDKDIVTNATVEEMSDILKDIAGMSFVGKTFGVLMVGGVEVATFRGETYETIGKPIIHPVATLKEDSDRRDFTVNALYQKLDGQILDYHEGLKDLEKKIIRTVGEPVDRFNEDASRILRGVYLAAKLEFTIEEKTGKAMTENRDLLDKVPNALKGKIIQKAIHSGHFTRFARLLGQYRLLDKVLTGLSHLNGLPQNPKYHQYDVWEHTLTVLKAAEEIHPKDDVFLLAALYHDNAKGLPGIRGVNSEGQPNDLGHEEAGAEIAYQVLKDLQFGKDLARKVKFLIQFHGLKWGGIKPKNQLQSLKRKIRKMAPFFENIDSLKEGVVLLFDLMECDAKGFAINFSKEKLGHVEEMRSLLPKVFDKYFFYIKELPINGHDIIQNTTIRGAAIQEFLTGLLQEEKLDYEICLKRAFTYESNYNSSIKK